MGNVCVGEDIAESEAGGVREGSGTSSIDEILKARRIGGGPGMEGALHAICGRLLFEIEVVTKDDRVVELFVDPQTGKLIQQGELKR